MIRVRDRDNVRFVLDQIDKETGNSFFLQVWSWFSLKMTLKNYSVIDVTDDQEEATTASLVLLMVFV